MTPRDDVIGGAVPCAFGAWRGLRDERVGEALVARAVAALADGTALEILKCDERSRVSALESGDVQLVLKEVRKGGARRRLADALRGGPARRAFRAGRGLIARGIGAALPLAALEQRSFGVPRRSLLVSLDLRSDPNSARLLELDAAGRSRTLAALAELMIALHQSGAVHGDLRAQHVHLRARAAGELVTAARLVDLESVRFHRRLSDARRSEDLAQLNASIPDAIATPAERRAALDAYAEALPFACGTRAAEAEIVRRSLARGHLFRGLDCSEEPRRKLRSGS
jgi:hypothetical protein